MCAYTHHYQTNHRKPPFQIKPHWSPALPPWRGMKMKTTDKSWALITGASSGFGEEFARQYAEKGHPLVLVARRLDRLQTLAEKIRQQHRIEVVVEQVDLSDVAAVSQLHQRLRERNIAIDILIHNADHGLQ